MNDKKLFLLDAYALIFRAYYALIKVPRLTRDGFNVSAIFGFVNTLEELLSKERPSHIAVCFDPAGPTFRTEAFAEYKGEREATPEDIKRSVPIIKEIIRAYRIPVLEAEGFEADDVIGTMARRAEKEGFTTYMMTPDKDFGQLVSPNILQYKPAYRGNEFEIRGEKEVCEKYGLQNTGQVIDLLALMGDKVDNIPGCPGVGEKTAVKLISEFGSVENLLENTEGIKGALRKKVEDNAEQIRFSKFLATIRTDVPLEENPDALVMQTPDTEKLFAIFKELEFRRLAERVQKRLGSPVAAVNAPAEAPAPERPKSGTVHQPSLFDDFDAPAAPEAASVSAPAGPEYPSLAGEIPELEIITVADDDTLRRMEEALSACTGVGIHFVAAGENDMDADWRGTALVDPASPTPRGWYIPAGFEPGMAWLLDALARNDLQKTGIEIKRGYVLAARRRGDDAEAIANYFDIALAHYLIQPETRHSSEEMAAQYLGADLRPETPGKSDAATEARDACIRAWLAAALKERLAAEVKAIGMDALLYDVELPLTRVLAEMELTGVRIDTEALAKASQGMEERLDSLQSEIHELAGEEFNVGSPAQVGEVLFGHLGLDPKAKKTKTGQYSTSEEVLEKVSHKHPIVAKILEYRQIKKLLSTYLNALPAAINPQTGRVHTNYNQTVTATGRISSSSPNLQNIPIREELGRPVRAAFIPSEGNIFFSADYSQIELRLVADFAADETMIEAFREGKDIHAITAAKIYGKTPEEVTADERRHAKTANFGILYGISAFGLANRLGIPRGDAKALIDNYFATFPTIQRYMNGQIEFAREHGYVQTRMGRRRQLPDINSKNPVVRGYAERNAINAPVQGSAADIIKLSMVEIFREMRKRGMKSKMIMQVHDELNFDVVAEELPALQELVSRLMENAYSGRVVLTASGGAGANWLEAH